eukprot:7602744-Pyramimonas_sp.AAC.1
MVLNISCEGVERTEPPNDNLRNVFLLPSFMTSGNEMVRGWYTRATGIACGSVYNDGRGNKLVGEIFASRADSKGEMIAKFWSKDPRSPFWLRAVSPMSTGDRREKRATPREMELFAPIPTDGEIRARPTLLKTHYPAKEDGFKNNPHLFDSGCEAPRHFAGIVHLVRNPVDNIVGNTVRWSCHKFLFVDRGSKYKACLLDHIRNDVCPASLPWKSKTINAWNRFNQYWVQLAASQRIPYLLLKYEDA